MTSTPVQGSIIPMRPLAIGDLFNSTFTIYKRNFGQFVLLGLIPSIVSLAVALAGIALLAAALVPLISSYANNNTFGAIGTSIGMTIGFVVVLLVGSLLAMVAQYTSVGMISMGVVQVNRGQHPTVRTLWRDVRGLPMRSLGLVGLYLLAGLALTIIFGALVALLISIEAERLWLVMIPFFLIAVALSIVLMARLGLLLQVLGIEGRGPVDAIKSCWRLTAGSGARIFGLLFLASFLISFATQAVSSVFQAIAGTFSEQLMNQASSGGDIALALAALVPVLVLSVVVTMLLSAVTAPFMSIYSSVLYIDQLRRRQAETGQPLFT